MWMADDRLVVSTTSALIRCWIDPEMALFIHSLKVGPEELRLSLKRSFTTLLTVPNLYGSNCVAMQNRWPGKSKGRRRKEAAVAAEALARDLFAFVASVQDRGGWGEGRRKNAE